MVLEVAPSGFLACWEYFQRCGASPSEQISVVLEDSSSGSLNAPEDPATSPDMLQVFGVGVGLGARDPNVPNQTSVMCMVLVSVRASAGLL